jgi:hypothetical protein
VALFAFMLGFTRTIGLFCIAPFFVFFVIRKNIKNFLYVIVPFIAIYFFVLFLELTVFHVHSKDLSSQSTLLLQKDPYDAKEGMETFAGFISRLFENSEIYLSKRVPQILGFTDVEDPGGFLTIFVIACLLFSMYRAFRSKNRYMQFACLYLGCMLGVSFLAVQTRWDQPRIVMSFVPLMVLVFFFALFDALGKAPWILRFFGFALPVLLLLVGIKTTFEAVDANLPVLKKNLKGDIFYGYTTDWVNYLKMSQWCADSLPPDARVATRKASMSFVYARGKEFVSINSVSTTEPDSVLNFFRKNKIDYVILASLRMNPNVANGNIINTLWQMVVPLAKKYPQRVGLVHQTGAEEPAYLYRILY